MFITVDSNILLSIFSSDSLSERALHLMKKYSGHDYIINDIIYLELGLHFSDLSILDNSLDLIEVTLVEDAPVNFARIINSWGRYLKSKTYTCPRCGQINTPVCPICGDPLSFRQKILPDFLIADFVMEHSHGILTFDSHFYKSYFQGMNILA